MYRSADSADDLMRAVFERLLRTRVRSRATRGHHREKFGVFLRLRKPRSRLSRSESRGRLFSALGELLWIMSGSNALDFISYYIADYVRDSEDGKTIYGAYGPRLFGGARAQIHRVIELLQQKPGSRRAVAQIFAAEDIALDRVEIPCTCSLQFRVQGKRLHMLTSMRSNDAAKGLPHDIFVFTMIQELVARSLDLELGHYNHVVGSLHLYETDLERVAEYLDEGFFESTEMPPMPIGNPWPDVATVLGAEQAIRLGLEPPTTDSLPRYWQDIVNLLQLYRTTRDPATAPGDERESLEFLVGQIANPYFTPFVTRRAARLRGPETQPLQLALFGDGRE